MWKISSFFLALIAFALTAMADAPPSLDIPDAHSNVSKGVLSMYRVQVKDLGFGAGEGKLETELFVTLDSTKDKIYTIAINKDSPEVNKVIADTLREAYLHSTPLTLYSSKFSKSKYADEILMVQLDRRHKDPAQSSTAKTPAPAASANE